MPVSPRASATGNLVVEQDFGGRQTRYSYKADGEVEQIHDAAGHQTEVERYDRGLVTAVRHDDGSGVEYAYDARGLLVTPDNGECPVERAYDAVGLADGSTAVVHRRYGYDAASNQPRRRRLWFNDGSCIRLRPLYANHVWAYDFVSDRTVDGRPLKMLTLVDEYSRSVWPWT